MTKPYRNDIEGTKAEAIRLAKEGVRYAEICKQLGMSIATLKRWLRGVVSRHPRTSPEVIREALSLINEGKTLTDVKNQLNLNSTSVIINWIKKDKKKNETVV